MGEPTGDDLRSHVARAITRLNEDVLMDRYGDPHVAFTVLLYPDSPPRIVALTPAGSGACDLGRLQFADAKDASKGGGRFFTFEELQDAARALKDAEWGLRTARREADGTLGEQVMVKVAGGYDRVRTAAIDSALEKATVEQARPMVCPSCKQRYTERGYPQHLRMSRWCGPRVAEMETAPSGSGAVQDTPQ